MCDLSGSPKQKEVPKIMARICQGNMHRSKLAHELLSQFVVEQKVDILLISEQYADTGLTGWVSNRGKTAAVWVPKRRITEIETGDDYVRVRVGRITYFSVYLSPNLTAADFELRLGALEDAIRNVSGDIVVGGDFNARATEWGMPSTNKRGKAILEMAA